MTTLLVQNKKMMKTSNSDLIVFNFGIPAFRSENVIVTCPMAGLCVAGCYATQGAYNFGNVRRAYESRLTETIFDTFIEKISSEIKKKLLTHSTKKVYIRIHDSGDFYNQSYLNKWIKIIDAFPKIHFYAYTKMVALLKSNTIPSNLKIIYSLGGRQDAIINQDTDRHSKVFETEKALEKAYYVNASENDLLALGKNTKIGLVYHGGKNYENTRWNNV